MYPAGELAVLRQLLFLIGKLVLCLLHLLSDQFEILQIFSICMWFKIFDKPIFDRITVLSGLPEFPSENCPSQIMYWQLSVFHLLLYDYIFSLFHIWACTRQTPL